MTEQTIDRILTANSTGNTIPITFKAVVFSDGTVKIEGKAHYPSIEEAEKQWSLKEAELNKDDFLFFIEE